MAILRGNAVWSFQIVSFSMQATEDRIQMSAGGFFNIEMSILPSVSFRLHRHGFQVDGN